MTGVEVKWYVKLGVIRTGFTARGSPHGARQSHYAFLCCADTGTAGVDSANPHKEDVLQRLEQLPADIGGATPWFSLPGRMRCGHIRHNSIKYMSA